MKIGVYGGLAMTFTTMDAPLGPGWWWYYEFCLELADTDRRGQTLKAWRPGDPLPSFIQSAGSIVKSNLTG